MCAVGMCERERPCMQRGVGADKEKVWWVCVRDHASVGEGQTKRVGGGGGCS